MNIHLSSSYPTASHPYFHGSRSSTPQRKPIYFGMHQAALAQDNAQANNVVQRTSRCNGFKKFLEFLIPGLASGYCAADGIGNVITSGQENPPNAGTIGTGIVTTLIGLAALGMVTYSEIRRSRQQTAHNPNPQQALVQHAEQNEVGLQQQAPQGAWVQEAAV